jgi:hypothetical protein
MKNALKIDSGTMIYLPDFIKTGTGIRKMMRGIQRHTDSVMIA